jgi:cellular nucleic acid-binding protein
MLCSDAEYAAVAVWYKQSRDCPSSSGPAAGGAGGECYKCGQSGHIARSCPNGGEESFQGGARASSRTCYNCGGVGHFSRDCSSDRVPGAAAAAGQRCYNCNEVGHMSRECHKPQTTSCYVSLPLFVKTPPIR